MSLTNTKIRRLTLMYTEEIVNSMVRTSGPYKGMVMLVMIEKGRETYIPTPPHKALVLLKLHKDWLLD